MILRALIPLLGTIMLCAATLLNAAQVGDSIPSFNITTVDGKTLDSSRIVGEHPLFLVFWATWCPNCKREIPHIKQLEKQFSPEGMEFLAINVGVNDSLKKVGKYIKKHDITYPVFFDNDSVVTRDFKVSGTPTVIIADKSGTVRYRDVGPPDDLAKHFEELSR